MNDVEQMLDRLPRRLRAARRDLGLSLEAVAKVSGVSRSMVSQIERGTSSPTLTTLWHLTRALDMPLPDLLAPETSDLVEVFTVSPQVDDTNGVARTNLAPGAIDPSVQVCDMTLPKKATLTCPATPNTSFEWLVVRKGAVTLEIGNVSRSLSVGEIAKYPADRPRTLVAGKTGTTFTVTSISR